MDEVTCVDAERENNLYLLPTYSELNEEAQAKNWQSIARFLNGDDSIGCVIFIDRAYPSLVYTRAFRVIESDFACLRAHGADI